jgi:hypothetical protein
MAGMNIGMQARWIAFALAVPISLYVTFFGAVAMGFCPGIECWPHTFAWTLLAPCLLLAMLPCYGNRRVTTSCRRRVYRGSYLWGAD